MKRLRFPRVESERLKELVLFGGVYLFLALINLRVKLLLTPTWFDDTLERNHYLLLAFQHTNNEQSRLLHFYIPEAFRRILGLSVPHAYIVQWWLFVFLTLLCFHFFLRKWFDSKVAFAGVVFLAAIMPLSYFDHLQQSAPLLSVTFLLALWAIREHRTLRAAVIMAVGSLNNETMLTLAAVFFFYNLRFERKHLIKLTARTIALTLPALLVVGTIRYLTRDRPHLGGVLQWTGNVQGIWEALSTLTPLDYWEATYLYIFFIFGAFWLYALLRFGKKPLFLRRAALMIPLFILLHLLAGKICEVRLLLPLSFVVIPMALFYLFPPPQQEREPAEQERRGSDDLQAVQPVEAQTARGPGLAVVLLIGVVAAAALLLWANAFSKRSAAQLAREPLRSAINLLQSEAMPEEGLICREIMVCGRISTHVPKLDTFWLPSPASAQVESLREFADQHPVLFLVEQFHEGGYDLSVERWLGERYGKVSQEWVDGARVARFVSVALPEPEGAEVLFGDQILLSGYAFSAEGRYLNLLLVWENAERVDTFIKPFIHVLDSNGEIVAQNDLDPVGDFSPASDWPPGSVVRDLHGLVLPVDATGEYQARIGWYDPDTGERLRIEYPSALQGGEFLEIRLGSLAGE